MNATGAVGAYSHPIVVIVGVDFKEVADPFKDLLDTCDDVNFLVGLVGESIQGSEVGGGVLSVGEALMKRGDQLENHLEPEFPRENPVRCIKRGG